MRTRGRRQEDGFTLIELMVVVLIIAILVAVAIPAMNAAWRKSKDRAAQADVQTALKAEHTWFTDGEEFTDDPADLTSVEGALEYAPGVAPVTEGPIYVHVDTSDGAVYISKRSGTGTCWYVRNPPGGAVGYANSQTCGTAVGLTYQRRPW
jgi:type IV pilus assembly protein PilA